MRECALLNWMKEEVYSKQYLFLYVWVFIVVWLNVTFSVTGTFLLGVIGPVYLYIKYVDVRQPVRYLKLADEKASTGILYGIGISLMLAAFISLKISFLGSGNIYLDWPVTDLLNIVITASLVEEIFFRGFLLQKLMETVEFNKANIFVTILFVILHFPCWLADGLSISDFIGSSGYLLGFSWLLGYVFKCSQSLWTPIVLHAANNYVKLITIGVEYANVVSYFPGNFPLVR